MFPLTLLGVLAQVKVDPDPGAVPGIPQLQVLINGLAAIAMLAALGGILAGAIKMSSGKHLNNQRYESDGKSLLTTSAAAAAAIGASAALINFFYALGSKVS